MTPAKRESNSTQVQHLEKNWRTMTVMATEKISDTVLEKYTRSDCEFFAVALFLQTGWPIEVLVKRVWPEGEPIFHYINQRSDGALIDITGVKYRNVEEANDNDWFKYDVFNYRNDDLNYCLEHYADDVAEAKVFVSSLLENLGTIHD